MHLTDQDFMQQALHLAEHAEAVGEVPVGAIVVLDQKIIGRGFNQPISTHDPSAHAEMLALREAASNIGNYRLSKATLYVTLEPCMMCMGAMVHARIERVVFGAPDSKKALNHVLKMEGGILAEECGQKLKAFFQQRR